MQGGIEMAGNRISHLGEPVQSNHAVILSYANEFYLNRDGTNWMRGPLLAGGFQVIRVGKPREEQDAVNLRTLQDSITSVLEQVTAAADTAVGNAVCKPRKHFESRHQDKMFELGSARNSNKKFQHG